MRWPPKKSWTSSKPVMGYRHFVAINYGGKFRNRWVALVSVLDGKVSFKVKWIDLQDPSSWSCGWLSLLKEESISSKFNLDMHSKDSGSVPFLNPSKDSGLLIPTCSDEIREWY